jgi:hypothetical protein
VLHIDTPALTRVRGLAEGIYGVTITTASLTASDLGDQAVGPGGYVAVTPPATGILTITRKG